MKNLPGLPLGCLVSTSDKFSKKRKLKFQPKKRKGMKNPFSSFLGNASGLISLNAFPYSLLTTSRFNII